MRNESRDRSLNQPQGEAVYAFDLAGNFTFVNHAGELILGYSHDEFCRMNIAQVLAPELDVNLRRQIVHDLTSRVGTVYEIEVITKSGRRVSLEVSTRVSFREGVPVEIEGIAVPSILHGVPWEDSSGHCQEVESFII